MLTVTLDLFSASHRQLLSYYYEHEEWSRQLMVFMAQWKRRLGPKTKGYAGWLLNQPAIWHSNPCNGLHVTESSVGTSLTSSIKTVVWGTLIVEKPLKICLDCWLYTLTVVTVVTTVGMRVEEVQHKLCQHINKWCQVILIARIVAKLLHSIVYQCIIMGIKSF